jgi:hypothetical protein
MKDADTLILKAFMASLYQQQSPLPQDILVQLNDIAQSLEARILELHDLAKSTPVLASFYQNARSQFVFSAAERGMGTKNLPADDTEDDDFREQMNITPDASSSIEEMEKIIDKIDAQYSEESCKKILLSPNPVTAVKNIFRN